MQGCHANGKKFFLGFQPSLDLYPRGEEGKQDWGRKGRKDGAAAGQWSEVLEGLEEDEFPTKKLYAGSSVADCQTCNIEKSTDNFQL